MYQNIAKCTKMYGSLQFFARSYDTVESEGPASHWAGNFSSPLLSSRRHHHHHCRHQHHHHCRHQHIYIKAWPLSSSTPEPPPEQLGSLTFPKKTFTHFTHFSILVWLFIQTCMIISPFLYDYPSILVWQSLFEATSCIKSIVSAY